MSEQQPIKKIFKKSTKKTKEESTFVLKDINLSALDKNYILPEIVKKQEREQNQIDDIKSVTTNLEKLGISSNKKNPIETIYWGDHYKIKLFVNNGKNIEDINSKKKIKCSWCHQYPIEGSLMLAVPYKYVTNSINEHVYAPECVNIVKNIKVEPSKEDKKKIDPKTFPKTNYFKRDLTTQETIDYKNSENIIENDYFETAFPVCSFNCMQSKGYELSKKDIRFKNVKMLISHLYWKIYEHLPEPIQNAPPCDILEEYGGDFTLEEYRKNFKTINIKENNNYFTKAINIIQNSSRLFSQVYNE